MKFWNFLACESRIPLYRVSAIFYSLVSSCPDLMSKVCGLNWSLARSIEPWHMAYTKDGNSMEFRNPLEFHGGGIPTIRIGLLKMEWSSEFHLEVCDVRNVLKFGFVTKICTRLIVQTNFCSNA